MSLFKRILRYTLWVLLGLLLLVAVLLGWAVATESGTRWVAARAVGLVPGELQIEQVSGRLNRDLRLHGIRYSREGLTVQGDSLALEWQWSRLLSGELLIERLALGDIDVRLPPASEPSEQPEEQPPFRLPRQLSLPLSVDIRSLSLGAVRITPADGEVGVENESTEWLSAADLQIGARGDRVEIRRFSLKSPRADLSLTGGATLSGHYPIDLVTEWKLRLAQRLDSSTPEEPIVLDGTGRIGGDLEQLILNQRVSGPLSAELDARLDAVLSDTPQWQADLDVEQLDMARWLSAPSEELAALAPKAQLKAHGDLVSAQLALELSANLPELQQTKASLLAQASRQRIEIEKLSLTPEQGEMRFMAQGHIDEPLAKGDLDATLSWRSLRYPPAPASPLFESDSGELTLSGKLDDYRLTLSTDLTGPDLPATRVIAEGQGSLSGMSVRQLYLDTLDGRVALTGDLSWAPVLSWNLALNAEGLHTEQRWPQIPGVVGARLRTAGSLSERLDASIRIEKLVGDLQGAPLSGVGTISVLDSSVELDGIDLGWGDSRLQVGGTLAEQVALDWRLSVPDLGRLLQGAQGSIRGEGRLNGARELPAIEADLNVSSLRYLNTRVESLDAEIDFDPGWKSPADIRLRAGGILSAGQAVQRAELEIKGDEQQLRVALDAESDRMGKISLGGRGKLTTEPGRNPVYWHWLGQLTQLVVTGPDAGHWTMAEVTDIELAPDRYKLSGLCLDASEVEGAACVSIDGKQGELEADLRIEALSLSLFAPFIPDPTEIDGSIDAQGRYSVRAGDIRYSAQVSLPRASLSLPDSDLELTLDNSRVEVKGDGQSAEAALTVKLEPLRGGIDGQVRVQDLQGNRRLKGELVAKIEQLKPLALLLPALQIQSGSADAALSIAGTLQEPRLSGRFTLDEGDIELPAAGIRVSEINLDLDDDPQVAGQMRLTGGMRSGEGSMELSGVLLPLQQSAELRLKGDGFQAFNTPEVQILVSPDLQLALSPQVVRVRGELLIPEALIQSPRFEQSSVGASPDLVVRSGDTEQAKSGPDLDIDLRVALGDRVRVDAFGFNGLLTGALNLQQTNGLARGAGSVGVAGGQYRLYGQDLNITRGNVIFTGGPLTNPGLDLRVEREVEDVLAGALVGGTLRKPALRLTSSPAMPDNRILSYLLLGRAPDSTSAGEQQMLMKLALSLGAEGGTGITEKLTRSLNLDEIGFSSGDTVDDTSFYIGKYLSPDLYIKYGIGLVNPVNTFLMRYQLSKRLALETETSVEGSGGDLIYSFER